MFAIAEKSLAENKNLEKVIILKRIFRCDKLNNDPSQIRNKLSEFGNRTYDDIWLSRGCPKNIVLAYQPLECEGELRKARFGSPSDQSYDGIHFRGKQAVQHYTNSVIHVLSDVFPHIVKTKMNSPPQPKTYADSVRTPATNHNIPAQPQFVRKNDMQSNYLRQPPVYRPAATENQFFAGNTALKAYHWVITGIMLKQRTGLCSRPRETK